MTPYTLTQIRRMRQEWLEQSLTPLFILILPLFFAITFTYHDVQTWKLTLATMGTSKLTLQRFEMPGCTCIAGSLRMTTQTAVFVETLKALSSDLRWCSCNIFSTQDHTVAVITHDESAALFSWKGESLKEYWDCILNALVYPEYDGKGHRPDLIVDDGGDMTLLVHEGKKAEDLLLKDGTILDPSSTDNAEFKIFQTIIKRQLEGGEIDKWNKIVNTCMGVSEETSTVVHHIYTMEKTGTYHQK